jgi:hypothetical protein
MPLSRRSLLKWIALTAGGAAVTATARLTSALAAQGNPAPLLWVNDDGADLNLLAQLGRDLPDFLELVSARWDVAGFDALQGAGVSLPVDGFSSAPVVLLEAIPDPAEADLPLERWVEQAKAVIFLGTEACYGGIRTTLEDVRRVEALCRGHKTPFLKLPGVPVPAHHIVGVLSHLEFVGFPALDSQYRPELYYGQVICEHCERSGDLEAGRYAEFLGDRGCLLRLGCKGPVTHNSCSQVRWNGGENWCVGAGGPCVGCCEPGFPDHGGLGLYGRLPGDRLAPRSPLLRAGDRLGKALLGVTAAGIALHQARRWVTRREAARAAAAAPREP